MGGLFQPLVGDQVINAKQRMAYDLATTVSGGASRNLYGIAAPGSEENAEAWMIREEIIDSQGRSIQINFAGGTLEYIKKWSERLTYTYS